MTILASLSLDVGDNYVELWWWMLEIIRSCVDITIIRYLFFSKSLNVRYHKAMKKDNW